MRETVDRHRVGKRTAYVSIAWTTPVAEDATHWDVEYADGTRAVDHAEGRRCPNAAMARGHAAKRWRQIPLEHPGARLDHARVIVERWDADEFEDDRYGLILGAEAITETEQFGSESADGSSIDWDDPEPYQSW